MKRILVTGGCGFITSNFLNKYVSLHPEHHFLNIDCMTYAADLNNLTISSYPNYWFSKTDICDKQSLQTIFDLFQPDWVVHTAAESHVGNSLVEPRKTFDTNAIGTLNLLECAHKTWKNTKDKVFYYMSCYDEETRVLTKQGLKKYTEVSTADTVLSINQDTGRIEEKKIEKVIIQDYNGEILHFKTSKSDLMITPNHRVFFQEKKKTLSNIQVKEAQELIKSYNNCFFPRGEWEAPLQETTTIKGIGEVSSKDLYYLCGCFAGDGFNAYQEKEVASKTGFKKDDYLKKCKDPKTGRFCKTEKVGPEEKTICHSYRIFFDVPENDKARIRLEQTLTNLKINWHPEKGASGEHIYISSKEWLEFFECFGSGAENKQIPKWMLDANKELLQALFDGLIDSDGTYSNNQISFSSCSFQLVQDICEIGIKIGVSPRFCKVSVPRKKSKINGREIISSKDNYRVFFRKELIGIGQNSCQKKLYSGKIWCLKVEDNKSLIIERNGMLQFCGNTDEVYGETLDGKKFTEETPYAPNTPYSASKACGNHLVRIYNRTYGIPTRVTCCSNNYGPNQHIEKFFPRMMYRMMNKETLTLHKDGNHIRDWLYVEDHCDAVWKVLEEGVDGEVYNVGGNNELTILDTVHRMIKYAAEELKITESSLVDTIEFIEDRLANDRHYAIDSSKIQRELGWKPKTETEEGFKKTVSHYIKKFKKD